VNHKRINVRSRAAGMLLPGRKVKLRFSLKRAPAERLRDEISHFGELRCADLKTLKNRITKNPQHINWID
jgi:hypothetical protein